MYCHELSIRSGEAREGGRDWKRRQVGVVREGTQGRQKRDIERDGREVEVWSARRGSQGKEGGEAIKGRQAGEAGRSTCVGKEAGERRHDEVGNRRYTGREAR